MSLDTGLVTKLAPGQLVLLRQGPRLITELTARGVRVATMDGASEDIPWLDLEVARKVYDGRVDGVAKSLEATFQGLSTSAQELALDRQEVVLTILTGFRTGYAATALPGEPLAVFDPANRASLTRRCKEMARILEDEASLDRRRQRAARRAKKTPVDRLGAVSERTLMSWVAAYQDPVSGGLLSLIDGRSRRAHRDFATLDPELMRAIDELMAQFDGTNSLKSIDEIMRRIRIKLSGQGLTGMAIPDQTARKYVSHQFHKRGRTTRSHTTTKLRGVMALTSYPAIRPGQVVAIDVTRADNFVVDPYRGVPVSVEIITALDICTRVVLALRVVPRSANAIEAGLILYDILRPFSMTISADRCDDWRWAGVPEFLGPLDQAVAKAEELNGVRPLLGEHYIPGILPEAVRVDHGGIFVGEHFRRGCDRLDIHLLLSRGKKPTDNAFVERWHETLIEPLLQVPGHKGRNVSQRGSRAGRIVYHDDGYAYFEGDGCGLTPRELEVHLREYIAGVYHRRPHEGLTVADRTVDVDDARAGITPLEAFDAMLSATGRLHVLQRPDLMYDLLPVRWGTISHAGVEFLNLTYDSEALDPYRDVLPGFFRDDDRAAPFFYDPRDMSRVWFRDPRTDQIHAIPWRRAYQLTAPMTRSVLDKARSLSRARYESHLPMSSDALQREILEAINDIGDIERLHANPELADWAPNLTSAHMRYARAGHDHAEAAAAAASWGSMVQTPPTSGPADAEPGPAPATAGDPAVSGWAKLDLSKGPR